MKKIIPTIILCAFYATHVKAELISPELLTPAKNVNLPLKKAVQFTWAKTIGASKYRIIFSTDKNFSNYDSGKLKCLDKTSCFVYTVASPSYRISPNNLIVKNDGKYYFWQVQAIEKNIQNSSTHGEIRSFYVGTVPPPYITTLSVQPEKIIIGSPLTIRVTLDFPLDESRYKIQITLADNDQPQIMTGNGVDFSYTFTPTVSGDQQYQVDIIDKDENLIDSNGDAFTVSESSSTNFIPAISNPIVTKTTGYSKIANDGSTLPDSATLGTGTKDWACTQDNATGLIWEVKTNSGLRNANNQYYYWDLTLDKKLGTTGKGATYFYTTYFENAQYNSSYEAYNKYSMACFSTLNSCDTNSYMNAINTKGLCNSKKWRIPTINELTSIIYCPQGTYNKLETLTNKVSQICTNNKLNSILNTQYFPNNAPILYWSSRPEKSEYVTTMDRLSNIKTINTNIYNESRTDSIINTIGSVILVNDGK